MLLTEEILDEILVDYILENFEIEDEEDLEYVYESLSEDDVDYILNEFNDFNFAKAHTLPPKLGKFRELKKSAKDSFYKAKERFFRPKPKKVSGRVFKPSFGSAAQRRYPEPKKVSGGVFKSGFGSAAQRRRLQIANDKREEKRRREIAQMLIKRPTPYPKAKNSRATTTVYRDIDGSLFAVNKNGERVKPNNLGLAISQYNMANFPGGKLPRSTVRLKEQEAKRRKAATNAAIQHRLAQQAAIPSEL